MSQGKSLGLAECRVTSIHDITRPSIWSATSRYELKIGCRAKKGQNDDALVLGRVSINTRTRLGTSLLALLQVKIMHYIGLSMQRKIALYVSFFYMVLIELYYFLLWTWTGTL